MDLAAALKGESFRPLATTIAPGALALAPFSALAYSATGVGREIWDSHPIAIGVALFILSLTLGLVTENIGSRIENWIDERIAEEDPQFKPTWRAYLLIAFDKEPVGQRYLRTILFRMKFELGLLGSVPFQCVGWFWLFSVSGASWYYRGGTLLVAILLAVWLTFEARDSAMVLARVRSDLVDKFGTLNC